MIKANGGLALVIRPNGTPEGNRHHQKKAHAGHAHGLTGPVPQGNQQGGEQRNHLHGEGDLPLSRSPQQFKGRNARNQGHDQGPPEAG